MKNITNHKHGRLTAIAPSARHPNGKTMWLCRCDCGNMLSVETRHLSGKIGTRSCGCLLTEKNRSRPVRSSTNLTHGESGVRNTNRSPEYSTWVSMKQRCNDKNHLNYPLYGGRGISVCDRWKSSFKFFLEDMGRKPSAKDSIDRRDVNGNYEPNNCSWQEFIVQANNRRNSKTVVINGSSYTTTDASSLTGIPNRTIHNWLIKVFPETDISTYVNFRTI